MLAGNTHRSLVKFTDKELHMVDKRKKSQDIFKFPTLVIQPDADNDRMYNEMGMENYIDQFLDGYNVTLLAYG